MQVPQAPCWQPTLGLSTPSSWRRTSSNGVSGGLATLRVAPLTFSSKGSASSQLLEGSGD